ncbi:DUF4422 domain-containing protein [Aggregatibacter kilianii]|uniref:DUF4422 domain-containing protein n=1 Tax=Aggregatibacter kilianii TaxID=2025884 RepID=UPI000D641B2C|nr:DUF4422 domain-containing protein [Aggregatibacter kilianii]
MKNNIKIFTCYHKPSPIFESECIIPIHSGKSISNQELNIIGDNSGDNISERNKSWCELTVLYWMWKNVDADYYGLFHYRRFLNFNKLGGGYDIFNDFSKQSLREFGWDDTKIRSVCSQYDVLTSPIWNIHPVGLPSYKMTNYDFYAKEHFAKDLDKVVDIISIKYPEMYPYVLKSLYSKECFFANMMIMNKKYFNEYCDFLFNILFEAESITDISEYDSYQKRIWGFIAERLSNCYLEYIKSRDYNLKYTQLGMVFGIFDKNEFSREEIEQNIISMRETSKDLIVGDVINIVFSIDDNYARYCAVAIKSILDFVNKDQKIHFYIVHDPNKLSEKSKAFLSSFEDFSIRFTFIKVNNADFNFYPLNREHISVATYYRLALPKLLPDTVNKIIYLDSDIIVLDNIAKLWNESMDSSPIAGVLDEGGVLQIRRLGLPLSHNYINAGITLMDINKLRSINLDHLFSRILYENYDLITLQDQDIINIAFSNNIKKLPLRWNVQSRMYKQNELEYAYSQKELEEAALCPAIVHFSDRNKPWQYSCKHLLKFYFKHYDQLLGHTDILPNTNLGINNFISWEILGDKAIIYLSFRDINKTFEVNKGFAKLCYRLIKKFSKIFK